MKHLRYYEDKEFDFEEDWEEEDRLSITDAFNSFMDYPTNRFTVLIKEYSWPDFVRFAIDNNIQTISSIDYHNKHDKEISKTPDFINTFPPHCMSTTEGYKLISETHHFDSEVFWNDYKFPFLKLKRNEITNKHIIMRGGEIHPLLLNLKRINKMINEIVFIDTDILTVENQKKIIDLESVHQIGCNQIGRYYAVIKNKNALEEIMNILRTNIH